MDEISADHLKNEEQKPWIVLKQVFVRIAQNEPFDISSYLLVTLTTADLNNVETVLEYIGSREKEWTSRLRILEWITANLETSEDLRALTNDDNIGMILHSEFLIGCHFRFDWLSMMILIGCNVRF